VEDEELEARGFAGQLPKGHSAHADVVKVHQEIIYPIVHLNDRIVDEVGCAMCHHKHVEQVVALIIPVPASEDTQRIYDKIKVTINTTR
jgi:hypothetical protein